MAVITTLKVILPPKKLNDAYIAHKIRKAKCFVSLPTPETFQKTAKWIVMHTTYKTKLSILP